MEKPTRYYSKLQEKRVAHAVNGKQTANSGATIFQKGDVIAEHILIECKTLTQPQKSHSVKKEWMEKARDEAISTGKHFSVVCIDYGKRDNYYILDELQFVELLDCWKRLKDMEEN